MGYVDKFMADTRMPTRALLEEADADIAALRAEVQRWQALYRRAVNEANGLTNYVEDRPELRSAERRLTAIETEARAAIDAARGHAGTT